MIRSYDPAVQEEVEKTLREFREGRLAVGTNTKVPVTSLRQALAIGRARARRKGFAVPHSEHWPLGRRNKS
jgi:hypothetical protein